MKREKNLQGEWVQKIRLYRLLNKGGAGRVSLKSLFFESKGPENGLQQNPSGKAAQQYHKYGIETIKSGTNKRGQE